MHAAKNAEVLISSGLHQFQHGKIVDIDYSTTIPFAHVALRGSKGQLLVRSGAYVPLKFCAEIDIETANACAASAKAARKARRVARKALASAAPVAVIDPAPLSWQA